MSMVTAHAKLNGIPAASILGIFDYDLTLVDKTDPKNTDHAPLTAPHYAGLRDLSERIGRTIIITARGEKSVLGYFGEHVDTLGRMPNVTLASNSGHVWHKLDRPRPEEHHIINIPGHSPFQLLTVVSEIHNLVTKMKSEFPDITADHRELCGAVVFQFKGDQTGDRFIHFHKRANELKSALPEELQAKINYGPKHWPDMDEGRPIMKGYIDITPVGMSKGHTVRILHNHYRNEIAGDPFVIVAGDSRPDYKMMTTLANDVPESRRLFISVGRGLVGDDEAYAAAHGNKGLLDLVLAGNGLSPVEQLHGFIANVGRRQTSLDLRTRTDSAGFPVAARD